jgi:hypothetical protein
MCLGGNPILQTDIKGDDYVVSKNVVKGKVKEITLSTTIFIKGPGASPEKAQELNDAAKVVLKSKIVNDVKINIKVNYVYDDSKKTNDLKPGENLFEFKAEAADNRSQKQRNDEKTNHVISDGYGTGFTGVIFDKGKDVKSIVHESMHFLGFRDRYETDPKSDNAGKAFKGFEKDIMGVRDYSYIKMQHFIDVYNYVMKYYDNYYYLDQKAGSSKRYGRGYID